MHAVLMNFGDNTRVVYDTSNKPFAIDIGQIVEAEIQEVHFHMIRRAVGTDTLMIVPKDAKISPKLQAIMDMLKSIETDPYDVVLQKFNEVGAEKRDEDHVPLKPTRSNMRRMLLDLAKFEVAKALHMTSKVVIKEEGDAKIREQQEREQEQMRERKDPDRALNPEAKTAPPLQPAQPAPAAPAKKRPKPAKKAAPSTRKRERL